MKVANRRQSILELVLSGKSNVDELCAQLGVSEATVRRDLTALAEDGLIIRTYGGAAHIGQREPETTIEERSRQHSQEKMDIALAALAHINDHDTLFLEGGTSTSALAHVLNQRRGLHVITNNLTALSDLALIPEGRVTVLGGTLRPSSMSTYGVAAQAALEHLSADKLFVSADGVVADLGLCEASAEQAYLKENMLARAAQIFVLADSTKLGRARQQHWTPLRQPWTLITNPVDDESLLAPFKARKSIQVEIAYPQKA
ncbi:DeoR family transcriptional regulator [Pseudomonas cichorii]|uniref:DeoR/GlpR family DNA-binding transcription regulator n=1 Tax=Pseudomonas cichorii TaxID=36746 RepID=UPI0019111ECE|nr:DeoR/GlpR family DNA-binding transcription regulator [Pseudomonas cichorii]GFM86664.1 DeoR family transcriptional regulator [Pseudomonas cichorii]